MGSPKELIYEINGGIDRASSRMELPRGKVADALNLVPRTPAGAQVVRGKILWPGTNPTGGANVPARASDLLAIYRANGTPALFARDATLGSDPLVFKDILGGADLTATIDYDALVHQLLAYRDKVVVAQQGTKLQVIDLATGAASTMAEAPSGGLACEFGGCVWNAADIAEDATAPAISVPLAGTALPVPPISTLKTGTANVASFVLHDASDADLASYAGKIVLLDGVGYATKAITGAAWVSGTSYAAGALVTYSSVVYQCTSANSDSSWTVGHWRDAHHDLLIVPVGTQPDDVTGATYEFLSEGPLAAHPNPADCGTAYLFNDSGAYTIRVYNRILQPIKITAARIKAGGEEFRLEDVPSLPMTLGPGASFTFKAIGSPQNEGLCSATVLVEHDFYAQGTLAVPITVRGTTREVLPYPSAVDFGAFVQGNASPALAVQIKNPLADDVTLEKEGWALGGYSAWVSGTAYTTSPLSKVWGSDGNLYQCKSAHTAGASTAPVTGGSYATYWEAATALKFSVDSILDSDGTTSRTWAYALYNDITLPAGKSITVKLKFNPAATDAGSLTDALAFRRTTPAKPYRVWRSQPGDHTKWNRDRDWVDLVADGASGGQLRAMVDYDNAVIVFKDSGVWAIQPGGAYGYRPVQITLGKGIGAFGPQAVCTGGGGLWWASKAGVFRALGTDVKRISDDLEEVWRDIAPGRYGEVYCAWYNGWLLVGVPYGSSTTNYPGYLYVYDPAANGGQGAWWKLDEFPSRVAVFRGGTTQEAVLGIKYTAGAPDTGALYIYDSDPDAATPWSLKTGYLVMGGPTVLKILDSGSLDTDHPSNITTVKCITDDGAHSYAVLDTVPAKEILFAGYATVGTNKITIEGMVLPVDIYNGLDIRINDTSYTITDTVPGSSDTEIQFTHSLPAGDYLFEILGANTNEVRRREFYFPASAAGCVFQLELSGTRSTSGVGSIFGFTLNYRQVGMASKDGDV